MLICIGLGPPGTKEQGGEGMTGPHRCRGDGAWIRLTIFRTRKYEHVNDREGARTANGVDRVQAGNRFRRKLDYLCYGFPLFP